MGNSKPVATPAVQADVVALIYKDILEEKPWSSLLNHLRLRFRASYAAINFRMPQDGLPRPYLVNTLEPDADFDADDPMTRSYLDEFFVMDPMYNYDLEPGRVVTFDDIVDREQFVSSEFYRRYLRPFGLLYGMKMCFQEPGGLKAWLMFSRGESTGNFEPAIKQQCIALLPHLELALEIYSRLKLGETKQMIYSTSMSQLVIGTIILDGKGDIIDLNQAATRMIAGHEILRIRDDKLVSTVARVNRELTDKLAEVLQAGRLHERVFCSRTMAIETAKGHIGVLIKSIPRSDWYEGSSAPHAIVYLRDPTAAPVTSEALMGELFSLSPAEARIAIQLAAGRTIAGAAEFLGLNESTVRTQTKRIFSKTGVGRQGELIILINQSVAQLGADQ